MILLEIDTFSRILILDLEKICKNRLMHVEIIQNAMVSNTFTAVWRCDMHGSATNGALGISKWVSKHLKW